MWTTNGYISSSEMAKTLIWCDASSIAIGVALDIDGFRVEDASWLRKSDDTKHINVGSLML